MTEFQKIVTNLESIAKVLDRPVDPADAVGLSEKMHDLISISSLAADCIARSLSVMHQRLQKETEKLLEQPNPPSANVLRDLSKAKAHVEIGLNLKCEEINKYVRVGIDGLRTSISLYKEEMHNNLQQ